MKNNPFKTHKLLVKFCIIALITYLFLFISISIIANILLFNLNNYKQNIINYIAQKTDYQLAINNIDTKFTNNFLPEIILNGVSIANKIDPAHKLEFKQINLNLSYSSLWRFNIIFNKISINSTKLAIKYNSSGDILLNGILISKHDDKKESDFNFEEWLLKQREIVLRNINFSFYDERDSFEKVVLKNINITYVNNIFSSKYLRININNINNKNHLFADLKWNGGNLEDYSQWKFAKFKLDLDSKENKIFPQSLQQYLPNIGFISKYKAKTIVNATMKNGLLHSLNANLNLNDLTYNFNNDNNILNFPHIGGKVSIVFDEDTNKYTVNAESIQLATKKGIILDNKSIRGFYTYNKNGKLWVESTNLNGINNLLPMLPKTKSTSVEGKISSLIISWESSIFKPSNYSFNVNFNKVGLITNGSSIPTINNISGNAIINKESGAVNLALESSTFIYKPMFYIPYKIKKLNSYINWQKSSESSVIVNINPTKINASDFNITAYGKYIYTPNTAGYIDLRANLDRLPVTRVGFYLPKEIDTANQWLQTSLIGGYGESATLTLQGWLSDFPFTNGRGKFYIDANINNGRLLYVKGWPSIDNIYGKFMIRNQKIIVKADKAQISKNTLDNALVVIPDMTAEDSYLVANGNASGTTQNFLNFLKHTPISKMIGNLPDKTKAKGNGKVKLYLKVPFSEPGKTITRGTYTFLNNNINFDMPIPSINHANGTLNFTNNSVTIDSITGNTLGGHINLNAKTNANGVINFNIKTMDIDYKKLANLYLPMFSQLIDGKASTNINLSINGHGIESISATSNLEHVNLNAPLPLQNNNLESSILKFNMYSIADNTYSINFLYNNVLFGTSILNSNGELTNADIRMGYDIKVTESLPAIVSISATPEKFDLIEWLKTIKKLSYDNSKNKEVGYNTKHKPHNAYQDQHVASKKTSGLPMDISLQTDQFFIGSLPFGRAHTNAYITESFAAFNMTATAVDGYGVYYIPENKLNLLLYFLNITKNRNKHSQPTYLPLTTEPKKISLKDSDFYFNQVFESTRNSARDYANSIDKKLNFPTSKIHVENLYYRGNELGSLDFNLKSSNANLLIDNGEWRSANNLLDFNTINYCFDCDNNQALVVTNFGLTTKDLGQSLSNLRYDGILAQTSGRIQGTLQWRGLLNDINAKTLAAKIDVKLKNGRFLKANTGTLLGSIIGIINLQTIVNIVNFKFSNIFANGYAFDNLEAQAYMLNNNIYLKYLYMSSTLAVVGLKGRIDLNNEAVNLYLNITPSLSIGVAVGAGIATLNPLIGVATYLAELALQNPVNKLFAFTFHITGSIKNPHIEQIGVSKQLSRNISSTVGK